MPPVNLKFYDPSDKIHNLKDLRMLYSIVNLQPIFATREHTGGEHHVQVAGSVGLLLADGWENLADAALAIAKKIDYFQTSRLAKGLKYLCA